MKIGVGIDFGTTNSAAAVFDGQQVTLVRLDDGQAIMPSATYIDRELQTEVGQRAIDCYIADNTGRTVEMIAEVIAETSQLVDHSGSENPLPVEGVTTKIYGQAVIDSGLRGRLFRGTKRLLGDSRVRRLMVFDHPFRLVALITPLLLHIRQALSCEIQEVCYAHLGHPVNFEGRDYYRNKTALTRLGEAYKHAGVTDQDFYPEPIAAAVSFLHANQGVAGQHLLTVDFGGGTLDFCVLRRKGQRFDVVTTHGVALGGDHIDQLLFRKLLFPLLGKGETWKRRGMDREIETRFPFEDYEDLLLNWAVTYTLNQNRFTTAVMDCIEQGGKGAHKFRRLRELIKQNFSYLVFQEIKDFKAKLSTAEEAALDIPEIDVDVRLTRGEFEVLIGDLLIAFEAALDETLERAGLKAEDIQIVLRTGGSSLIPAVRNILDARFPERVVEHDPFTSVAAGLAIANYQA
ncbi:MAG: Hsp70 family protein [Gammaproteobacteria bacterium]|nr:Hsp70 family protein [Gammaproteobacteria bacterium]